ncbi:MAG: M1 family metallopeptidase [Candidatus Acidiferrales bacterium]
MIRSVLDRSFRAPASAARRLAFASGMSCAIAIAVFMPADRTDARHRFGSAPAQSLANVQPNTDAIYQELRNVAPSGKAVAVKDLELKRDAGTFRFRSGTFYFLAPVKDLVTGAIFIGDATFSLTPPSEIERTNLQLLTKSSEMVENFSEAIFRFSDGTESEVTKGGTAVEAPIPGRAGELLAENRTQLRKHIKYNLDIRLLEEVLNDQANGFFAAFLKGKKYSNKEIFAVDPHGVPGGLTGFSVEPEEVAFSTYEDNKYGVWAAFHLAEEYAKGRVSSAQRNNFVRIPHQKLDTTIDKNGFLVGTATTTVVSFANGLRVVPLRLYPSLRVQGVVDENQKPLGFIQEKKEEDSQFAVILPEKLSFGKRYTITVRYGGPDVVSNEGGGNYYPIARESWYPNTLQTDNFATYDMTFRIPAGLTMVATGTASGDSTEGNQTVSKWMSDVPIFVAGFNFGRFKRDEAKLTDPIYTVEAFANTDTSNIVRMVQRPGRPLGTMNTTAMLKKALGEEQLAIPLYTDYYGPTAFGRLAVTQQTAANYGQSWPSLVFLPITSFFDDATRAQLGFTEHRFFEAVGPHEIAHQWWGHTVGWSSYRDQWMSEGFAEFSAALFLQTFYKNEVEKFWDDERKMLTEKDKEGFRAIDVGPVTLGYRLASTRAGFSVPRRLIYPKGAYILNMIRMLMWNNDTKDERFKGMMRAFVQTYSGRAATTEDFKSVLENYVDSSFNLTGDGKMDWFFDEYVYGTAFPRYTFDYSFSNSTDGLIRMHVKVEQSDVGPTFRMLVPVYIELPDGRPYRVGAVALVGNGTAEQDIALRGLSQTPKRAMINSFHDVLCAK